MRRITGLAVALALVASSCLFGGATELRTVLVDFSHDEFASFALENFPAKVTVPQGTELVFRQTWTGEPHTITGGRLVDETLAASEPWTRFFDAFDRLVAAGVPLPNPDAPGDATAADFARALLEATDEELRREAIDAWGDLRAADVPLPDLESPGDMSFDELVNLVGQESEAALEGLPWAMDENDEGEFVITQNAGQACYLAEGEPPSDPETPCEDDEQVQPDFDGTHTYYNSGMIPYEGPGGNTFRVPLAEDIEPGTYWFYCAVHGPQQATEVEVVAADAEAPSPDEVTGEARGEIDEMFSGSERLFRGAVAEGVVELEGERVAGPFAGLFEPGNHAVSINEFVPRKLTVEAGEPITWKMMGADHSISFDVPEYFPIMEFLDDGRIRLNPKLQAQAGGAPKPPEEWGEGEIPSMDGGTYDGEGFWSSGLLSAEPYLEYTLRISEPGTYDFACLIHPPMVGTIEVTA